MDVQPRRCHLLTTTNLTIGMLEFIEAAQPPGLNVMQATWRALLADVDGLVDLTHAPGTDDLA